MKSHLFKVTTFNFNRAEYNTFERYVSGETRHEAIATLAIELSNTKLDVVEIKAITPGTGKLAADSGV